MIRTLVAATAIALGLAGDAVAQQVAPAEPATPAAPTAHHLPPHHPVRHHVAQTAPAETPKP